MLRNPLTCRTIEPANGVSRRVFLQAAAAGGGLMLSLRLPLGDTAAAGAEVYVPNAFVRITSVQPGLDAVAPGL